MSAVFDAVLGRPHLNHLLESYAQQPVHAYLYLGPSGSQREAGAFATAAALLCEQGGCGTCTTCQRVLSRVHPDVLFLELEARVVSVEQLDSLLKFAEHRPLEGKALTVDQLREDLIPFADRRPLEGSRKVAIVPDISGIEDKAPIILKTLEEPYPGTFFILLTTELTPGMSTVASRCTTVQFPPVPEAELRRSLEGRGLSEEQLGEIVQASLGSLNRADLLADDPAFLARLALWRSAPERLDGSGAASAALARDLLAAIDESLEPLKARQERELAERDRAAEQFGNRSVESKKNMTDRHKRVIARFMNDELHAGLGVLARCYAEAALREDLETPHSQRLARQAASAVDVVTEAQQALSRNVGKPLVLGNLFSRIASSPA